MQSPPNRNPSPIKVAVLAFDGISPFHLWVPTTVFEATELDADYTVHLCSETGGAISTQNGLQISIPHEISIIDQFEKGDMLIIPTWANVEEAPSERLLEMFHCAVQRELILVGLCLGAYPLAASGLLDNRRATTHWAYADDFAKRFPNVHLHADTLYEDEGQFVTSAGVAAGMDCCLHLMRRQLGPERANRAARRLVIPPHREGGQAQFIERPLPHAINESRLAGLLDWIRGNLKEKLTIDTMAERAGMSRRSFTRLFQKYTGMSFTQWLLSERLGMSQYLLESTSLPLDAIAYEAGFGSVVSLRHHFRQKFGTPPGTWRKTFRGEP